jgi:HK97 family phage portal protein
LHTITGYTCDCPDTSAPIPGGAYVVASLLGKALRPAIRDEAPIPYVSTRGGGIFGGGAGKSSGPLAKMGQVGTLFAIVDRICTAVIAPDWNLHRLPKAGAGDGELEVIDPARHAAAYLWANPNPHMTQAALMEMVQQHGELLGEGFLIVVRKGTLPLELWPVRPDRMSEVPHPTEYLKGWVYTSPDGDKIPLEVDDVIHLKGTPNPENPYRGMGRVQALIRDLEGAVAAAEWAANFFKNSAQPGGIIEVEGGLTDDEFDTLRMRWQEQHRGIQNAHKVAILEHGTWRDRSYSMRDLEFSSLRNLSRDQLFEAWGISRATMGLTDGVNYAAAKAAQLQMAELITEPRLERWKQALNSRLLPMFGATGKGVTFDFESPVPTDADEENAERASKVAAVTAMVAAGWNPQATAEAYGLPDIAYGDGQPSDPDRDLMIKLVTAAPAALAPMLLPILLPNVEFPQPAPPEPPKPPDPAQQDPSQDDQAPEPPPEPAEGESGADEPPPGVPAVQDHAHPRIRAEDAPPDPDLSELDAAYQKALDALMERWDHISAEQRVQLRRQIVDAVNDGDLAKLAALTVDTGQASAALNEAMLALATIAAGQAVTEGAAAGVVLTAATATALGLAKTADLVTTLLGSDLALAAGREAARLATPGVSGEQVATQVDTVLKERSTASTEAQVGGALHASTTEARVQTFLSGPVGRSTTEVLDKATCVNCRAASTAGSSAPPKT